MGDLSKEIKQSNFSSGFQKAIINLLYTSSWFRNEQKEWFKGHNILSQHYNVLRIVNGQDPTPATPGYIKEVMLDKGRDLTRLIDKLVKLGYLHREPREDNKRKMNITITAQGKTVVNEVQGKIEEWIKYNRNLSEDECHALSDLLDKLRG